MFNEREGSAEIPQRHMAVTRSPRSPFVLCQKQGSESLWPLNKASLSCCLAAAVSPEEPVTQQNVYIKPWLNFDLHYATLKTCPSISQNNSCFPGIPEQHPPVDSPGALPIIELNKIVLTSGSVLMRRVNSHSHISG